jgi:hypothetical protein
MASRVRFRLARARPGRPHDRKFDLSGLPLLTPGFVHIQIKQFILNRRFSCISCSPIVNAYTGS